LGEGAPQNPRALLLPPEPCPTWAAGPLTGPTPYSLLPSVSPALCTIFHVHTPDCLKR